MNKKSIIKNVILVLAFLLLTTTIMFSLNDISNIIEELKKIKLNYLLISLLVLIGYWLFWGLSLFTLIKDKNKEINSIDLMLIANTDLFFNGITPFSSGGQPFQFYALRRANVSAPDATSGLMMNFIVHQLTANILSIISLVYYNKVASQVDTFIILVIVGFTINFAILAGLLLISLSTRIRVLFYKLYDLVCKIKIVDKFIGNKKESFENYIVEFQSSFKEMLKNKKTLFLSIIYRTLCLLCLYAIPFVLLLSLGLNLDFNVFLYSLALSAFNFAFMSYIPLPGASVGAEMGLQTLLLTITGVTNSLAVAVILLWRFLTYYLSMIYGFITYLIFEKRNKNKIVEE